MSLPYVFQVLYVMCFTRPRYQVSVYRTIGPLVYYFYVYSIFVLIFCVCVCFLYCISWLCCLLLFFVNFFFNFFFKFQLQSTK